MTSTPQRVADLFATLVELEPAEAERRIESECCGDESLASRVRELLAHDREAGQGFLARPTRAVAATPREPRGSAVPLTTRLGRYHVLHKLGEGGMASVYVGYDEVLDRRVALKVVRSDVATREWLLREGQALGRLAHPNVVSIYEVGEHEGFVFLAMELVEGLTLRQWLDAQPRTFAEILRLFLQAGRGLAAAHRAGLVHRDFKPENVLVGKDGRARVADFGISALACSAGDPGAPPASPGDLLGRSGENFLERSLTQQGAFYGTPAYMAPEQFDGDRASIASDQWSFAVAFYRAAYGVAPFPHEGSLLVLANRVRREPPSEPPRRPDLPLWLWPILARSLARLPAERFPSMDAALAAINEHVPRNPDLDPTVMARERRILTTAGAGVCLIQAGLMLVPATARVFVRPAWLLAVGAAFFFVTLGVVVVRWRKLAQNAYGKRIAMIPPTLLFGLFAHRALGLCLGLSGEQILVEDYGLLALGFAAIAHGEHRWLWWLAAIHAMAAVLGTALLGRMTMFAGLAGVLTVLGFGLRSFADRHLSHRAAVGGIERDELGV